MKGPLYRRALLAAALVASTLTAGVINAPVAQAAATYQGWVDEPLMGTRGLASTQSFMECQTSGVYSGEAGETIMLSIDNVSSADVGFDQASFAYTPGSTATLRLEQEDNASGTCSSSSINADTVTVTIREMTSDTTDGTTTQIGATSWVYSPGGAHNWSTTKQIEFDTNPLNGTVGTPLVGSFELHISVEGPGPLAYTSRGVRTTGNQACTNCGPTLWRNQAGYLVSSSGFMAGLTPSNSDATELAATEAVAGKDFPIVRMFADDWELPCQDSDPGSCGQGDVRAMMEDNKLVIWTNKPDVTPSGNKPDGVTPHTKWSYVASGAVDGGAGGLDAQINRLHDWADNTGAPGQVIMSFHHEPHDDATEKGGSYGTYQDYRAAFKHVKDRITALSATRVQLAYIAVDSNAVKKTSGNAIGTDDQAYPGLQTGLGTGGVTRHCTLTGTTPAVNCASANVDLLAHDVYNYYQYEAGGDGIDYHNGSWRELGDYKMFGSTTGVVTLAKKLSKKIIFAETGSHPGCLTGDTAEGCNEAGIVPAQKTRDDWFHEGLRMVETEYEGPKWFAGFSYFHKYHTWDWRFMYPGSLDTFHERGQAMWGYYIRDNPLFKAAPVTL